MRVAYGVLQELQVGDRNASLSMPGTHSRLKLTKLRSQSPYTDLQALHTLHHCDLSSPLPPANPLLFSEQVKHSPASGLSTCSSLRSKTFTPSNTKSLLKSHLNREAFSQRSYELRFASINGNPTHTSGS